jgi:phosphohistidine phosphatase
MKQIVIVRHAKAVPYGYEDDFNRDLTERGINDATKISSELKQRGINADIMVSSPAKRALKTAHIFAENMGFDKNKITYVKDIYDGMTTSQFLKLIHELNETAEIAFFFGHNPDIHNFVDNLLKDFGIDMPTCSTVAIDFYVEQWEDVEAREGVKAFHFTPRMFIGG